MQQFVGAQQLGATGAQQVGATGAQQVGAQQEGAGAQQLLQLSQHFRFLQQQLNLGIFHVWHLDLQQSLWWWQQLGAGAQHVGAGAQQP